MDIKNGKFILGDCLSILMEMADESCDLILTSPPYDNLRAYTGESEWNFDVFKKIAVHLVRVLKPGGVIVWVVGDETVKGSETGSSFRQTLYFKDHLGLNLHDTMIWNKGCFSAVGSLRSRYAPVFEYMFILSKGGPKTFNPIKDKPNIGAGRVTTVSHRQADGSTTQAKNPKVIEEFGQRFNIWDIGPHRQRGGHPAPFPENLAEDHIISWSNPGDLVFDPFGGSGTTARACENTNRAWVSCEISEDYYWLAVARIMGI